MKVFSAIANDVIEVSRPTGEEEVAVVVVVAVVAVVCQSQRDKRRMTDHGWRLTVDSSRMGTAERIGCSTRYKRVFCLNFCRA